MSAKKYDLYKKEDVEKISKYIRLSYQKFTKRIDGADDCAQEVIARMLAGQHQHSTIDQAVIDYLRTNSGRKGLPGYSARKKLEHAYSPEPRDMERLLNLANGRKSPDRLDFDECASWIGNQVDRGCLGLFYKWGLDETEIGNLFGFSCSRVSQRLKRIQSCISERIKAKESRAASGEMAAVLRPQAERQLWGVGEITFERMEIGKSIGVASFNEKSF